LFPSCHQHCATQHDTCLPCQRMLAGDGPERCTGQHLISVIFKTLGVSPMCVSPRATRQVVQWCYWGRLSPTGSLARGPGFSRTRRIRPKLSALPVSRRICVLATRWSGPDTAQSWLFSGAETRVGLWLQERFRLDGLL
jgi:hypothetical protein